MPIRRSEVNDAMLISNDKGTRYHSRISDLKIGLKRSPSAKRRMRASFTAAGNSQQSAWAYFTIFGHRVIHRHCGSDAIDQSTKDLVGYAFHNMQMPRF